MKLFKNSENYYLEHYLKYGFMSTVFNKDIIFEIHLLHYSQFSYFTKNSQQELQNVIDVPNYIKSTPLKYS